MSSKSLIDATNSTANWGVLEPLEESSNHEAIDTPVIEEAFFQLDMHGRTQSIASLGVDEHSEDESTRPTRLLVKEPSIMSLHLELENGTGYDDSTNTDDESSREKSSFSIFNASRNSFWASSNSNYMGL